MHTPHAFLTLLLRALSFFPNKKQKITAAKEYFPSTSRDKQLRSKMYCAFFIEIQEGGGEGRTHESDEWADVRNGTAPQKILSPEVAANTASLSGWE